MTSFKALCVFCGASAACDKSYIEKAFAVGELLAENDITLVYGGATLGLMGSVANGALSKGGRVIGVIPEHLQGIEKGHLNLTELHIVKNMHERKQKMFELSEGIIVLPGGFGTLDEIFEILTWKQLALHTKPIAFLNHNHYWNNLKTMIEGMQKENFLREEHLDFFRYVEKETDLLSALADNKAKYHLKFIGHSQVLVDAQ